MQTKLSPEFRDTEKGETAEGILRKCVHCGFCLATCPTYQLLGDELDGPRGRIYLIKQVLEGAAVTRSTQQHLDRCLTCRSCETTCPSGVDYGHLVEIGRQVIEERVKRPTREKFVRWVLKEGLTSSLFGPAMKLGALLRPLLPQTLQNKLPSGAERESGNWPARLHARKVLLLSGCVQPSMRPNINAATARVLDAAGIQTLVAAEAGCCGAIRMHLNDRQGGLNDMRRNIDAWWPTIENSAIEAIIMNASGCGVMVKYYGAALATDTLYAKKAARVSALTIDLSELLPDLVSALRTRVTAGSQQLMAFHSPCTLQHGQRLLGGVEQQLRSLGFKVEVTLSENYLCCGSAGTYSVLEPKIAYQLRDRKLAEIERLNPQCIISANIGCIQHLQSGTSIPVKHWIEILDRAIV